MRVDVVMLVKSADQQIIEMTQNAIDSLHASESDVEFKVFVIESGGHHNYKGLTDYDQYPFENGFNYNEALNAGVINSLIHGNEYYDKPADYIVLANNDLIFHPNWFTNIHRNMVEGNMDSASPKNPGWMYHTDICDYEVVDGWSIGREFCGWCLVFRRKSLNKLLPFDERFVFWCQDNDLAIQMQKKHMKHSLVGSSHVTHLTSRSHRLIPNDKHHEFTHGMGTILNEKYSEGT